MTRWRLRLSSAGLLWFGLLISPLSGSGAPGDLPELPPNPYDILASEDLETPFLDAVPFCEPEGLRAAADPVLDRARAGDWRSAQDLLAGWMEQLESPDPLLRVLEQVFAARSALERSERVAAESRLRAELRTRELGDAAYCLRTELARLLMLLDRESEAAAQWTMAERLAQAGDFEERVRDVIATGRAEVLYQTGHRFDAHLAFREITKSKDLRLAAAARLRLTDLSFDSGNIDRVSLEYETLLPRAPAFGGSMRGWALRAAEAALDAGHKERAARWIELYLASNASRDGRAAAEIRLADLEAIAGDPLAARKRLSSASSRRRADRLGALASIRAIDLGVFEGSPSQRIDVLKRALRRQRHGVRHYALSVLMAELESQGDLEGALAVGTRLAYAGADPIITPHFPADLDRVLKQATEADSHFDCESVVRALGGRYGILIERSEQTEPFKRLGLCFEELELPWLAAKVYRSMTRRFGTRGAATIALPLARSSLAIGEMTLARRMGTAALKESGPDDAVWRAILAEADFREGRMQEAATGLRSVLESETLGFERAKLVRFFALALSQAMNEEDLDFLSESLPRWLAEDNARPGARADLIESALLAGHAQRSLGHEAASMALYRLVDREAPPGALRSSARFWLGRAQLGETAVAAAWGEDPSLSLGAPWDGLANFERAYSPLGRAYRGTGRGIDGQADGGSSR